MQKKYFTLLMVCQTYLLPAMDDSKEYWKNKYDYLSNQHKTYKETEKNLQLQREQAKTKLLYKTLSELLSPEELKETQRNDNESDTNKLSALLQNKTFIDVILNKRLNYPKIRYQLVSKMSGTDYVVVQQINEHVIVCMPYDPKILELKYHDTPITNIAFTNGAWRPEYNVNLDSIPLTKEFAYFLKKRKPLNPKYPVLLKLKYAAAPLNYVQQIDETNIMIDSATVNIYGKSIKTITFNVVTDNQWEDSVSITTDANNDKTEN